MSSPPGILVRTADERDLDAILSIYNDAVLNTTAVWNEAERSVREQQEWFASKQAQSHPVLVAVDAGTVIGFASYGPFRAWYGYRFTVENSVYVQRDARRRGAARALLLALSEHAAERDIHVMVAGIEAQNDASIRLHAQCGFQTAGRLHEVGYKFGRWLDLVFMEKRLQQQGPEKHARHE